MKTKFPFFSTLLVWFSLLTFSHSTQFGLFSIYQPLSTLGSDMEESIIISEVPVLINSVPENLLYHIAVPNKLIQGVQETKTEDSNLLSRLGISLHLQPAQKTDFKITMNLSAMGDPSELGVTTKEVIIATIECVNKTFLNNKPKFTTDPDASYVSWQLKFEGNENKVKGVKEFEKEYFAVDPERHRTSKTKLTHELAKESGIGEAASVMQRAGIDYPALIQHALDGDERALKLFFWASKNMGFDGAAAEEHVADMLYIVEQLGDEKLAKALLKMSPEGKADIKLKLTWAIGENEKAINEFSEKFPKSWKEME